jgi:hypothetical protein
MDILICPSRYWNSDLYWFKSSTNQNSNFSILNYVSYLLQHLVKVGLWHLLEQDILDLRHEHRIVLHFPAQLHVDTRLAVSFTVRFFWQA